MLWNCKKREQKNKPNQKTINKLIQHSTLEAKGMNTKAKQNKDLQLKKKIVFF